MKNEFIPKILKQYRKQNPLSANDVTLMLHESSVDAASNIIDEQDSESATSDKNMPLTLCEMHYITNM